MWVDFAIHASFPQLTWHDCINEYACEYPWFVVFSSGSKDFHFGPCFHCCINLWAFDFFCLCFYCHPFVAVLLLTGNAGIHIFLIVYDCCNFHCSLQLTCWFFRVRPFSSFLPHMLSHICRSIFWSHIICLYQCFTSWLYLSHSTMFWDLKKKHGNFRNLVDSIKIHLN